MCMRAKGQCKSRGNVKKETVSEREDVEKGSKQDIIFFFIK